MTENQFKYLLFQDIDSKNFSAYVKALNWITKDDRVKSILNVNKDLDFKKFIDDRRTV